MELSYEELAHYGILRKSGRYPWGSGENPYQNSKNLMAYVSQLQKQGLSEAQIAQGLGMKTTQLRAIRSMAKSEVRATDIATAQKLKDRGLSNVAIGDKMGINESSVRSLLAPSAKERTDILKTTAHMLRDNVEKKTYLDVGKGVENHVGVSKERLGTAVAMLEQEGYKIFYVKVEQVGVPGKFTTVKVLAPPGTTYSELYKNQDKIGSIINFSDDSGRSYLGLHEPLSVDSSRVDVRYAEQGGADADGVIYVRPGIEDVSLGKGQYAQVRIAVDGTHYLKGMAIYKDDLPDGVDLQFNTNKKSSGNKLDAMKSMKEDSDNPFGATVRQIVVRNDDGTERVTSAMNLVNEEGEWGDWTKSLSSQMLSKQSPALAKKQLDLALKSKQEEFNELKKLTNPTVKKELLQKFADSTDSSAVHLKAASLPRQGTHVILPINGLKDNEVYAPNFKNGENVALIRYPHGGTFEIPELRVNNKHVEARKTLGNAPDAIGINSKVAQRLSGADFDGDTVLVIPNNKTGSDKIRTSPALQGLKNFDPQTAYPGYEGMPPMSARAKQQQMGNVSNLITDMTIKGATQSELARAVRHSMVVIDAEKHNLNYKQSSKDNGIPQLKQKYQGSTRGGASTIISRSSSDVRVPVRKERPASEGGGIDSKTGAKVYQETGESYVDAQGRTVVRTQKSTRMAEATDAYTLTSGGSKANSGTQMEAVYAGYANSLKALANEARKEYISTPPLKYSPSAKKVYAKEVETLNSKLNVALQNSPLERQAQLIANTVVSAKRQANPGMDNDDLKKVKSQALAESRNRVGANKKEIAITDREWEAIQAGAISNHKLTQVLQNADLPRLRELATPRSQNTMTPALAARARAMLNSGATQAEVAEALGVSTTTIVRALA